MKEPAWNAVLKGQSVLVTGHTGFKGSWLVLWLARMGAVVSGYGQHPISKPDLFTAAKIHEVLKFNAIADLRDMASLRKVIEQVKPALILHLAAQPIVAASYQEPKETFEINVMGTVNVLESVRLSGVRCSIVVVTSDKCYENLEREYSLRECDPMGGRDPYSASKGAAEIVAASYRASFFSPERQEQHGVRLATARAGNTIGGGDWADSRIIPDAARALARGQAIEVRNPSATRPWQHVLEPLSGYLRLGAGLVASVDPRWCSAWNFGPWPGDELRVSEVAELFCQAWGEGQWVQAPGQQTFKEAHSLRLCIDKAVHEANWRPLWTSAEAVRRSAHWYKAFYAQGADSARGLCIRDIEAYEQSSEIRETAS
ncbi:MAG: CDP-glucose 4,6-dehydratase [Planctomycetes bacterium]|nr:CDP-glucose 4,6-dehydratase [Planctomycetota bacterium]